jgi:hypothetical protein
MKTERQRKEEAMARAEARAKRKWKLAFLDGAFAVASDQPYLTTDDIWDRGVPKPADQGWGDNRAAGPLMVRLAKANIIERTNETRRSSRRHEGDVRIWKSLVFENE